jgi:flagellar protein FliS
MATTEQLLAAYQQDQVNLASPEALTLMLYRAALKGVGQTREVLGGSAFEVFSASQLARDILLELADNVNMDHPQAGSMRDLYLFCWRTVIGAPSHAEPEAQLASVETVLKNLIDGLETYIKGQPASPSMEQVQPKEAPSLNFLG